MAKGCTLVRPVNTIMILKGFVKHVFKHVLMCSLRNSPKYYNKTSQNTRRIFFETFDRIFYNKKSLKNVL